MGMVDHLVKLIEKHDHFLKFSISNDGDPFASLVYRDLLSKLNVKGMPVEIEIVTNGILAKAHWHKMEGIHNNVIRFKVSMDAGTPETYAVTRRGGAWDKLIESIKFIAQWKKDNNSAMDLMANFVVQNANYKDMVRYVELCEELGFTEIYFQRITDWGTFANFAQEAIWQESHPNYAEFIEILRHPALKNPKVNLTNLTDLLIT
jgi:sulfatase maturation enzyme AslB (radical SAM superfamily)